MFRVHVRRRAVRLVLECLSEHPSDWAELTFIALKRRWTSETLRAWARQAGRDASKRPGRTTSEREPVKHLEQENREPKRASANLRHASVCPVRAEVDRRPK